MTLLFETVWHDLRSAARSLLSQPQYTTIVLLTLGLAVGGTVAIYSVLEAVLLADLPFANASRLVTLAEVTPDAPNAPMIDYTFVQELSRRNQLIESAASYADSLTGLAWSGESEVIRGLRISFNFFDTLGVRMLYGRTFAREEDQPGRRREVILSHALWKQRFGADPQIVGRVVQFDDATMQVLGVLPATYRPLIKGNSELVPEYYIPLGLDGQSPCHRCQPVRVVARLKGAASVEQARRDIRAVAHELMRQDTANHREGAEIAVVTVYERLLSRATAPLRAIAGAVGFVLLIACVNVSNLGLTRAVGRKKELAIRMMVGASRLRTIRPILFESVLLSLLAGVVGLLLALVGTRALTALAPVQIPRIDEVQVDGAILRFALFVSVGVGILCGLAPAIWAVKTGLGDAVRSTGQSSAGSGHRRLLNAFVVVELTLAFVLTVSVGLLGKSVKQLLSVDPGYDYRNVLTLSTRLWSQRYSEPAEAFEYYRQALENVRAIPGVEGAALTNVIPMDHAVLTRVAGAELSASPSTDRVVGGLRFVSPDYFSVLRIPLRRGRLFNRDDGPDTPKVAVISDACARALFKTTDPVGQRIKLGLGESNDDDAGLTVVGVVGDIRQDRLDRSPAPEVYVDHVQEPRGRFYRLVARTAGNPMQMEQSVREAFLSVDRTQPVYHVKSLDAYLFGTLSERSFALALLSSLGGVALILAAVGVYAVTSYSVRLRVAEIGVRLAVGAQPRNIVMLVFGTVAALAAVGVLAGIAVALGLTSFLRSLLFEVAATDPPTFGVAILVVAAAAFVATLVPAWRAASLDPMVALRHD